MAGRFRGANATVAGARRDLMSGSEIDVAPALLNGRDASASDRAYEVLRRRIIRGELAPGVRIPAETLAGELGISRSPVREALIMLEAEGLVVGEHNKGYSVRPLNRDRLLQMYELRGELEAFGIRMAVKNADQITQDQRHLVESAMDRLDYLRETQPIHDPDTIAELVKANRVIHDTLIGAAGNPELTSMIRRTVDRGILNRSYDFMNKRDLERANQFHRMIVERFFGGDADGAAVLMKEHMKINRDNVIDLIDKSGGDISAVFGSADVRA